MDISDCILSSLEQFDSLLVISMQVCQNAQMNQSQVAWVNDV